jgi:pSer/pThr/pTyr-binding forkhead associated (FHA) protein
MRQVPRTEAESHHWPILEPLSGERERPVALNKPVCVAGDRGRVNLPLPSDIVSRAHALFLSDKYALYVRDLASLNHLFINDQPVREAVLHDGDVVKIGPFAFRCDGPPEHEGNGVGHAPAAELKIADGSIRVPLASRSTVIGRRDDCDVIIDDDLVSKAHAVIFETEGRRYIRDLRSRHGTFLNDRRVGQADLKLGDQIRIGDSVLTYQAATASEDSEGTLAGAIAEEAKAASPVEPALEANPADEQKPAAADPAPPPEDLDVIPLMEDSGELKAVAAEFAQEHAAAEPQPEPKPQPPATEPSESKSASSDSGIIPLLDESESAPGVSEPAAPQPEASDDEIPIGIALDDDDDDGPPQSLVGSAANARSGSHASLPGSRHGQRSKDEGLKSTSGRARSTKSRP